MNIADKLTQITERMPMVYEAGQKSMVDESKIIEKTVIGSVISLDDVSEVPHEVSVQLVGLTMTDYSGVVVKVLNSKNLFNKDNGIIVDGYFGNTINIGINYYKIVAIPCMPNTTYTVSKIAGTRFEVGTTLEYPKQGTVVYDNVRDYTGKSITITTGAYAKYLVAYIWNNSTDTSISAAEMINSVQIELGHSATTYESYSETIYTAEADGSVKVKSLSPYMTILPDINDEVIYVTYHKSWGMQTEYDRFWDAFQNNGEPILGDHIFAGKMWNDACYNPKHSVVLTQCTNMYRDCLITDTKVDIDVSRCSNSTYCFNNAEKLVRIRKLIVSENTIYTGWFAYDRNIEEIHFEGVIGKSLDLHYSTKLSAESYDNIFSCLSTTATGQILTVPSVAPTVYDAVYGNGTWAFMTGAHSNWEIKTA